MTAVKFAQAKRDSRVLERIDPEALYKAADTEARHAAEWAQRQAGAPDADLYIDVPLAIKAGFKPSAFVPR